LELRVRICERAACRIAIEIWLLELLLKTSGLRCQSIRELIELAWETSLLRLELHLLEALLLQALLIELLKTLAVWRLSCGKASKLRLQWLEAVSLWGIVGC
jgi:hypothetical protein